MMIVTNIPVMREAQMMKIEGILPCLILRIEIRWGRIGKGEACSSILPSGERRVVEDDEN